MPEQPLLSVIVPTVGRPSLRRTLRSLLRQGDRLPWEAVLVGDTHAPNGGPGTWAHQLPSAQRLAQSDPRFVYTECDGGMHAWGHPQRNHGATVARGKYLAWLGDDDIYLPGAFEQLARALYRREDDPRVLLFRWIAPWKQVLWHTAGFLGEEPGHIDAECIVCPNVPAKLGVWRNRYQGDFDFIAETVERWGGLSRVIWQPEVIAQAQPSEAEDWTQGGREVPPVAVRVEARGVLIPFPLGSAEAAG
jgi:glycosyltransferase involved in cell wall biosynthesis